eukprot:Rmarinus@m.16432
MSLARAAASGQVALVTSLLEQGEHPDQTGPDGTTPLCAAATWGHEAVVKTILNAGGSPNAQNEGTKWTALHSAVLQERGKVVMILLNANADPNLKDRDGRSAADFASVSDTIWPFFGARGCTKASKQDLIEKRIIQKVEVDPHEFDAEGQEVVRPGHVKQLLPMSRPGSAYVFTGDQPQPRRMPGGSAPGSRSGSVSSSRAGSRVGSRAGSREPSRPGTGESNPATQATGDVLGGDVLGGDAAAVSAKMGNLSIWRG